MACIGAKENIAKVITDRVGASITNPIMRHLDDVRMKEVDEYQLHNLVKAVMDASGPDRDTPPGGGDHGFLL